MYNAQDLARKFKVTPRTIRSWARLGYLPRPLRISPACIRWREEDIAAVEQKLAGAAAGNSNGGT